MKLCLYTQFKLSVLELDEHARDKFLRLVGNRYDAGTDLVTIVTDCCPLRKQNLDYAFYLLTALYHESWVRHLSDLPKTSVCNILTAPFVVFFLQNVEPWEEEKLEEDMEKYVWEDSVSRKRLTEILASLCASDDPKPSYLNSVSKDSITPEKVAEFEPVRQYSEATTKIHNLGKY